MGWDSSKNRGYHFGYWGAYNRIHDSLQSASVGEVDRLYANEDISMEEFGFKLTQKNGKKVRLDFYETDPIRKLRGTKLGDALLLRVKEAEKLEFDWIYDN